MATLSQLKQQYTYKTGVSSLLTENQRQTITTHLQEEEEARRNQGGFFGGIGYAFEKLGLGFLSSIEGIWDYTAGGLAKLFGADEWAEQQFANDWVNYNHADEWFNPSEGWQFVGDVAGGIGTSLPAIATVVAAGAIAVASGGTLSPVAAALISGAVAGLGAAGNATKQAYRETGELGGKEFGYGALVGITEGAVEGLSAGIGAGTGQIVKGISKSFGKEVAETVTRQTIGKAMIKGFIGEAFEEGLSEILDPVWARLTYDPNAKNATLQEVGYAALVGGLSGAIMGGVDVSIRNVHSMSRGNTIVKEGKSSNVISMAEQLSTYEGENHTGYEQFEMVNSTLKELQTSMQKTNGEIRTAKQRMLLGVLEQANTTAAFTPFIARSAENIVNNADVIAEKLTAYGIKDAQGNPVTFTAEQIRSGVDTKNTSTFVNALKTNSVLRALAVADATGRLSMDTAKFKDATLRGQQLSTQADLNQFIENATDVERQAVGERLSISDWNTLTNEQFQQKIVEFSQNGGVEAYQQEQATVRELQNIDPATAKKMPARLNLKKDGTVRYTDGAVNIAVTKNGDTYRIYDYDSGKYSKPLTQAEANKTIREIKKAQAAAPAGTPTTVENQQATDTQGTQQQTAPQNGTEQQGAVRKIAEQLNSERQQTQEIDTYARKNVPDYAKLNEPNKSIIRSVIRQGRAAGIADADVLSYARVAAHTGINVVFDKSLCAVAVNSQTGEKIYSDGYYDPETNKFVVNPETTRTHEALLLHELTHAIYRTADGRLILERGVKNMSQAEKDAIIKRYSDVGHGGAIELMDEINAHYAEGVLTNKNTIEKLVAEKPKLKDRILSFFKKSSTAYEGDTKLSKSAKSLYNRYKKLFDSFSERNRQYNAAEYRHTAPNAETRYALQEALQQLGEYDETRKRHIENREGDTISRNYGDIVEFIKTAKRLPPVKRLHIGIISDATAKLVKTKTDVDIKNYDFVLASNFISHIFDSHGTQRTETPRNQKAVTYANIENIIETVIAPDDVTLASDENGTALKFIKDLDGKNVALTITSTKKSTLTLKSAWIIENSEGRTPSANATASARTSETSGRNLTTDSISENGKKVNRNGKKDGKRYALQIGNETAQVDIEETKNLVALHNLSEEKLLKVLQLGGFPMPSIAVTKAELSHTDYGDITVIFGKETISPTDRRNKVYKRDAWTPTMPQVDVKFNTKEFQTMEDAVCDLVGENKEYRSDIQRFFDQFHNYNGEYYISESDFVSSEIARKAKNNAGIMAAYLAEKGKSTQPVYKDRKFMQGDFSLSEIRAIADNIGITQENVKEFYEAQAQGSVEQTKKYQRVMGELKRAYIENYTRRGIDSKSATEIADDLGYSDYTRYMDAIRSVLRNPDAQEYDSRATEEALRNRITDNADFEKWLFDKISATEERRGIENGADPFTASGKRRSFAQMHDEYSIQNIVRNMLRGEQHGSTFFGHNANSIAARLADEFTSIKSIKEASYLLTEISESEYDALMDKTFEMSSEIVEEIDTRSGKNGYSDSLTRREDILDMIAECATVRPLTAERILSKWNSQYQGYDLGYKFDKQTAQKVLDWFTILKQLPTKYFEAKPRRVVEFSEIKSVLIPESASEKLKTRLTNRGVPYQVYGEGENTRTDIIKTMDGIRFALPDDENNSRDGLTRGQRAKFAANNTRPKVYSKIDATEIVNSIIDERLVFDDKYGSLSGKSRAQVIDTLFTRLNNTSEGYRIGVALDIADYIINNAVLTDMYDSYDDVSYSMETLSAIRRYMHKVDLSGIKGEIQYKFDKKNTVSLVWGAKQGGMAPDVIAQELQSFGINIEAINEADQFFEMLEIYEKAKSDVSKKAEKVSLTAYGSKAQIEKLRQQIARDILTAYDEKGTQSKYGKLVEKYTNQIESLTKQVRQARRINSIVNSLVDSAQYLRDIAAKRNYVGAEVFSAPELTSWLKNLGKLKYRSDLRKSGARKILLDYGKFYNTNNPLLYDADPNLTYIDNNVLDALNFIQQNADSTKPLSLEELQAAQVIMASAKHLFQYYDQMTMEGKKVRISEAATAGNAIIQKTKSRVGRGFFNNIYGVFNKIVEPRVVIKSFENYNPNGILTRAYSEITRGETAASLQYIQLVEKFDDYFKANKKYRKRLTSEYITVAGAELNVGQALSLYELSKREQAKAGLYEAGFSYVDKKGKKQTVSITESDIDALQSAFTDSDKQFIAIVEDFFNVQSKKVKTDADLQILGYTNASDDFYFPIQRDKGTIAKNITDARDLMADWANVYNFSFNKDVKTGAKNKIFVPEIWSVITRHAKQLSTYAHLTVPLKNFSQIYAKNIGDKTHVQSIRNTLNEQVWGGADAYLSKLFSDIQGKATSSSVIEKLRGAYAKYQLGANLKVIVSQLTSYPTAGIELDFRSMVKGAVMKTDYAAMDKYCDYARVRNYEKGVVRAEGVIDKVGKVGDIFTKPIQWTDRAAIGKIWNACQVQIERNDGHKIGTVENMQAAGVLLEEVIRLTQPNYTNTVRSALMRSDSDIVRSFTMFTSVPLKQLSRLVESVGEYKTLRQMIKSGDTNADIQSRYKKAKKRLGKTLASITVANLMYTMVAQFFKWLYAKDRKDKDGNEISFVQDFFTDFASTTIGMFPVVKDIYNYFANDYEFSNFAYDSINSILSTTKDLFEVATKAAGGEPLETSDYMKPLRNSLYAIGQITGLPIRNINNTISGVIKRFSPATAYKYNSMFYNAQYSKDIKAALANGDTELADTIMSLMLDEDKAGNLSAGARKKLIELYEREYEVLPRSIGDSVSYNGEKIELTAKQREKFKKVYGQANGYIERMLQNKSFAKLSADKQAKAIKQVYDAYYDKALAETLGVSSDNKLLLLSKFMGIESLSIALAGISDITSDKDKNSATVQGSKKKKVIQYLLGLNFTDAQRLLILFMQGYKIGDGEYKRLTADRAKRMVISYILSLNKATQAEKAQLAQMCGVEVKNGRIVTKSLYAAK